MYIDENLLKEINKNLIEIGRCFGFDTNKRIIEQYAQNIGIPSSYLEFELIKYNPKE